MRTTTSIFLLFATAVPGACAQLPKAPAPQSAPDVEVWSSPVATVGNGSPKGTSPAEISGPDYSNHKPSDYQLVLHECLKRGEGLHAKLEYKQNPESKYATRTSQILHIFYYNREGKIIKMVEDVFYVNGLKMMEGKSEFMELDLAIPPGTQKIEFEWPCAAGTGLVEVK